MDTTVERLRDLLIIDGRYVVATDSIGGIGDKAEDSVYADPRTVIHFALRVPLLEVICAGAQPIVIVDSLGVEMEPTGALMIEEVRRVGQLVGVDPQGITGSTEDNVPTRATGLGVTVIGRLASGHGRCARIGDVVVCVGLPLSAPTHDIYIGHPDQVRIEDVRKAVESSLIHDALPVGSKGIAWELTQMAQTAGLEYAWTGDAQERLVGSGGPSSCVLLACRPGDRDELAQLFPGTPSAVVATMQ